MGLIDIVRISDGRVVEHWSMGDSLGMMQQLGVIPQPGQSYEASPSSCPYSPKCVEEVWILGSLLRKF
jgi:hypothetical protein